MKRLFALFLFSMLILSGCVSQSYTHNVDKNGNSEISVVMDFSKLPFYASQFGKTKDQSKSVLSKALAEACENTAKIDKSTECSVQDDKVLMKKSFTDKDGYYTFEVNEGIPYRTYRMIIYKIPSESFAKLLYPTAKKYTSDFLSADIEGVPLIIDLRKKQENAITASGLKLLPDFDYTYEVQMPGEIINSYYGNNSVQSSGNKVKFNLVQVLEKSEPLVIESKEINILLIGLIIGAIIIIGLWLSFFSKQKDD